MVIPLGIEDDDLGGVRRMASMISFWMGSVVWTPGWRSYQGVTEERHERK